MIEREREDETPISSKPDSPDPEIFSKKTFFLNSYSGNRRSEIPHIESDYCPTDEVGKRLFHQNSDSYDCDCVSDGCGGCLRRNKQCFLKFFVLILSLALILFLFGSLSHNLTRNKDMDESLESDRTKWVSHYHEYSVLENKESPKRNATVFIETEPALDLPIPVYEHLDDYDSEEDFRRLHHHPDEKFFHGHDYIEPISFPPFKAQEENYQDGILIIYDNREPQRTKRYISSKIKTEERGSLEETYKVREILKKSKRIKEFNYKPLFEELSSIEEGMEEFWENYFKKGRTVFEPFSLTTPFYSAPVQNDEYSIEDEIEDELKNRFLSSGASRNFDSVTVAKQETSESISDVNWVTDRTDMIELYGNSPAEQTKRTEKENHGDHEWTTVTLNSYSLDETKMVDTESSETTRGSFSADNFKSLRDINEIAHTFESNFGTEYSGNVKIPLSTESKAANKVSVTEVVTGKNSPSREAYKYFNENSEIISSDEREFRTLWPLFHFSVPLAGLFGSSQQDQISVDGAPLDTVKGISLADAKKIKKERRKHLLLNSRVVGGSTDVRLPTGPDVSKPFMNAFETLKTNQQLSFTPSAASQFIFPYQMCLFAGNFPGPRPFIHGVQPRTFSLGASPLIPSIFDKGPAVNNPYQMLPQQNFLSFSINNYPNAFPPRQSAQTSGSPVIGAPIHQQFSQFPGPNKQPIFCTYLQPPLFQFPTVPGTADFSHAKCVDCSGDSQKDSSFAKESIFFSGRDTICSDDRVSCADGSSCIPLENWCDNQVHCKDTSDEAFCSCRERLAKERLCDGYIDCPHGEDETACYDCPKSAFSCDSVISPESCIPLSKRCDGVRDCTSGADERDCSALFFNMHQNNSYQVSQISGYLHRNWKGDWFPVCVEIDGSTWAKEACLGELGVPPSNVDVNFAPVSAHYKGPFIVRKEDGTATLQDHCKGHISTFVKCPAVSCGTRVELYSLQKLENRYYQMGSDVKNSANSTFIRESRTIISSNVNLSDEGRLYTEETSKIKREETGRVVGGRESDPRAWPWAIAIYKNGAFHCGGVILDEKWVLTAAHCMEQYWKHYYEVRGGLLRRFSFSAMEQTRTVSHVIMHENYDLIIMSSDLALLRLQKPFYFNRWIRPACLPVLQDGISKFTSGPAPGTRCTAVGWGALRERGIDPDQLREVEIPIMTRCKHKEDLVGEEICAGKAEGGKDTCQGDSGGPLLCRDSSTLASWYVAGIVSHGEGCARPGEPGAYTRISLFIDWITTNTNDFQLPSVRPLQNCPGFRCHSASKLCIPRKWVCNGYTDCLEAEDEKNCAFDSVTPNIFSRKYSRKYNYFESGSAESSKLGKNSATEKSLVSKSAVGISEDVENQKKKAMEIQEKAKEELSDKGNKEPEKLFHVNQDKEKTKDSKIQFSYNDYLSTTTVLPLTSIATPPLMIETTKEPLTSLGNLRMSITENPLKMVLTTEENKSYRTLSVKNVIYEEKDKGEKIVKSKKEENTREGKASKNWIIEEESVSEKSKKTNEKVKEGENDTPHKEVVSLEKEKEKTKSKKNKMIYKYKEVKNAKASEEIGLGGAHNSRKDENYKSKKNEEYEEKIMNYREFDTREKINDEKQKKKKNEYKILGHDGIGKEVDKTKKSFMNEALEGRKKLSAVQEEEEEEITAEENSVETSEGESEEEGSIGEKVGTEEEEKNSLSIKYSETDNLSLLGDLSITEKFFTNTFNGITEETFISIYYEKESEFSTESVDLRKTEVHEKDSAGKATQTKLMFIEPITVHFDTTETAEKIFGTTEFRGTESVEPIETEKVTPSQHLIRASEAYEYSNEMSSDEYSTKTYSSVNDRVTDISKRNSEMRSSPNSEYFQCRLIVQSILTSYLCDGSEDCEDGTDEENCTCRINPKQICDGRMDCPNGYDEKNCFRCLENEFHCKISDECISLQRKCDGITDCKFGEDEAKCLALADNGELTLHASREPFLKTEGVLMVNRNGVWRVKCQEEPPAFAAGKAIEVCSLLGTIGYERFQNHSFLSYNCTGFYVSCSESLISKINRYQNRNGNYFWPWNAFLYSDGLPICTAALLQSRWLLTSSYCLKDVSLKKNYVIAKLGSNNLSFKMKEADAKTIRIDGAHLIPGSDAVLLHLSKEINQTESVRPLGIPYTFFYNPEEDFCVAVGERTVFLKISEDCPEISRCYKRVDSIPTGCKSKPWAGVIVCQSRLGWYPASVFSEKSGYCGFRNARFSNLQGYFKILNYVLDQKVEIFPEPFCSGFRCFQGLCIPQSKICNGVPDCFSKEDETFELCKSKNQMKECKITELKCRNGLCIPKTLFGDGTNDCGDKSDEPWNVTCVEYLRLTAPERICDGRRNCYDKTDEDYKLCPCEIHKFQCKLSGYCIPTDFVCDGEKDCPGGEDEEQCMGRQIIKNYSKTHWEVVQKSYGIWHTVCPDRLTKEQSDALCRDLGFTEALFVFEKNQTVVTPKIDAFSWVKLNRKTSIALRGNKPFVKLVSLKRTCGSVRCA